ncbi:MAG: DMT family transporter [Candidatus Margulisbacteria bacterium]|nr:DMT family transporter [Candidatus Margulisiibacteriota bacterium]
MKIISNFKGVFWMMVFCVFIPLGDALTRTLIETGVHVMQAIFLEYSIITLVLLPFVKIPTLSVLRADPLKKWHILRCISFFLAALFWLGVIAHVPLTQLYAIGFLAPIFASFLSVYLLKETLTSHKVGSLIVGLLGTFVIIRPGISEVSPFLLIALFAPLAWAFTTVSTKRLTDHYSHLGLLFIMSVTTWVLSAPFALYYWTKVPSHLWGVICVIASIGLVVHFALILAFRYAPLTVLLPLEFSTLIFATLYGSIFFNETIDMLTYVGALMIVGSTVYITIKTNLKVRPVSSHLDI